MPSAEIPSKTIQLGNGLSHRVGPRIQPVGLVRSTLRYLMRTEVHTFAFSVAANAILSFFPFVVLLMTLTKQVFHSNTMSEVVIQLLLAE